MPVYKNTIQNQKLGRVGKEYSLKGINAGNTFAKGGGSGIKGAAAGKKTAKGNDVYKTAAKDKVGAGNKNVYKDTPNNRKLNRVGKPYGEGELSVPLKQLSAAKKKKEAPKPAMDMGLFMDVMNVMSGVGKQKAAENDSGLQPGKVPVTPAERQRMIQLKSELNVIKGRPSLSLFQQIIKMNKQVQDEIKDTEENLMEEFRENLTVEDINKVIVTKKKNSEKKSFEELTDSQKAKILGPPLARIKMSKNAWTKNAWNTIIKGPGTKMKRWSYNELIDVGKKMVEVPEGFRLFTINFDF
mgnify:CR=1 FL=1